VTRIPSEVHVNTYCEQCALGKEEGQQEIEEGWVTHFHLPIHRQGVQLTTVLVQMEFGSQPPLLPSLHSSMSLQT
jgi:hypothetical protein